MFIMVQVQMIYYGLEEWKLLLVVSFLELIVWYLLTTIDKIMQEKV